MCAFTFANSVDNSDYFPPTINLQPVEESCFGNFTGFLKPECSELCVDTIFVLVVVLAEPALVVRLQVEGPGDDARGRGRIVAMVHATPIAPHRLDVLRLAEVIMESLFQLCKQTHNR